MVATKSRVSSEGCRPGPSTAASRHSVTSGRARKSTQVFKRDRKVFQCNECNYSFPRKTALTIHNLRQHPTENPYKCETCKRKFSKKRALKLHMVETHRVEPRNPCHVCGATFANKVALFVHTRTTHQGEKPYKCEVCDHSFAQKGNMKTHMRLHTGERPYNCPDCDQTFIQLNNLQTHIRSNHTGPNLLRQRFQECCEQCSAVFNNKKTLLMHVRHRHSSYASRRSDRLKSRQPQQFVRRVPKLREKPKVVLRQCTDTRNHERRRHCNSTLYQSNKPKVAPTKQHNKKQANDIREATKTRTMRNQCRLRFQKCCLPVHEQQNQTKNTVEVIIKSELPENAPGLKSTTRKRKKVLNRCDCCESNSDQAGQISKTDKSEQRNKPMTRRNRNGYTKKLNKAETVKAQHKHQHTRKYATFINCQEAFSHQCKHCFTAFKEHRDLFNHKCKMTGNMSKSRKTKKSKLRGLQSYTLSNHARKKKPHRCKLCTAKYKYLGQLKGHVRSKHNAKNTSRMTTFQYDEIKQELDLENSKTNNTDSRGFVMYKCEQCSAEFELRCYLLNHVRLMHKNSMIVKLPKQHKMKHTLTKQPVPKTKKASGGVPNVLFKCEQCNGQYQKKGRLLYHIKRMHGIEQTLQMTVLKPVSKRLTLVQSRNSNVNGRKFAQHKCGQCNAQYKHQRNLACHIRLMHSTDKLISNGGLLEDATSKQPTLQEGNGYFKSGKVARVKCVQNVSSFEKHVEAALNLAENDKRESGMEDPYYCSTEFEDVNFNHLELKCGYESGWVQTCLEQKVAQGHIDDYRKSNSNCYVQCKAEFEPTSNALKQIGIHDARKEHYESQKASCTLNLGDINDYYKSRRYNKELPNWKDLHSSLGGTLCSELPVGLLTDEVELLQRKVGKNQTIQKKSRVVYCCDQCKTEFWHRRSLLRHVRINHVSKELYHCEICKAVNQKTSMENIFTGQIIVAEPNKLLKCGPENLYESVLEERLKSAVEIGLLNRPVVIQVCKSIEKKIRHECGKCGVTFEGRKDLHQHLLVHASESG